jgi:hypothetical protein
MKFEASKKTIFKVDEASMVRKVTKVKQRSNNNHSLLYGNQMLSKAIKTKLLEDHEFWIPDPRHWSTFSYIFILRWHD